MIDAGDQHRVQQFALGRAGNALLEQHKKTTAEIELPHQLMQLVTRQFLAALVRPDVRRYGRRQILGALALGLAIAAMTVTFYEAITRVPLGLVVAIEFMGPLSVAAFGFRRGWRLVWPVIALCGVLCLVRDREGWSVDLIGLGFAVAAGVGWGSYILLTKRIGARVHGIIARHQIMGMLDRRTEHKARVSDSLEFNRLLDFLEHELIIGIDADFRRDLHRMFRNLAGGQFSVAQQSGGGR